MNAARSFWRRAWRHPGFVTGGALTALLLLTALLSLVWTPWPPGDVDMHIKLRPPSAAHWLGTDAFGRDVLSQLMAGAQSSLQVGVVAVGIGLVFGTALGLLAGALRGWSAQLIMRCTDFALAFPALLTAIMITARYGASTTHAMIAIGLYNIPAFTRLTRAAAKSIWTRDYILAARACGKGPLAITLQHVLPNIGAVLMVQITVRFAIAILAEAALSYLGLGTPAPQPSWGRMLADGQTLMFEAPLLAVLPGLAIALAVLGLNLLGDALRDVLDPRLARAR